MDENTTQTPKTPPDRSSGSIASLARAQDFDPQTAKRARFAVGLIILVGILWFIPPVYWLKFGPIQVQHWHRSKGEITLTVGPGHPTWISIDRISKHALHAILVAEDAKFYDHHGLDFAEIWASFKTNLRKGRYARGGSTITQQVVKVAFLSSDKTLIRKAREALGAMVLELVMSKTEILEWYINLVQFGDGVYGIKEGCWHYFKTKPEQLTIEQAAHLALVLPSPNKWSYGLRQRQLTDFGHRRFATIVLRMLRAGYITKVQWEHAMETGNFGGPIKGYKDIARQEEENLCGNGACESSVWDEDEEETIPQSSLTADPKKTLFSDEAATGEASPAPHTEPLEAKANEEISLPDSLDMDSHEADVAPDNSEPAPPPPLDEQTEEDEL